MRILDVVGETCVERLISGQICTIMKLEACLVSQSHTARGVSARRSLSSRIWVAQAILELSAAKNLCCRRLVPPRLRASKCWLYIRDPDLGDLLPLSIPPAADLAMEERLCINHNSVPEKSAQGPSPA